MACTPEAAMKPLALILLLLPMAAAAQDSPPRGSDCETPRCAAGTVLNPQTNSCEPVSS